ncbi:unnamed protein product [Linum trigynum]|uniref:Reverse transcriptase zinc-binding domain-containing protein n=1 Tax=Linum trigynum TaxID=586398 RepID=A0AAV2GD49_9ROSI
MDWDRLWKLQIPPKVKILLWRLAHEILPTGKNIEKKKKDAATECPFCNLEETQTHIFRECQWASRIWRPIIFRDLFEFEPTLSSGSWLCEVMERVDDETLEKLGLILWLIWHERNNQMFNKPKAEEWAIIGKALDFWEEYKSHHSKEQETKSSKKCTWEKPLEGWVMVNMDAAVMAGEGTGLVVRDENGKFLLAAVRWERKQWPPEIAELRAMDFGLQMVERQGFLPAVVESDCQNSIQKIKGEEDSRMEAGVVARELKERAESLGQIRWSFTKRTGNETAHLLAHSNYNWDSSESWALRPPMFILPHLEKDNLIT